MGCGVSKFEPEGEAVPVGLRPLLRRRIEDIRRRKNASVLKSTLSKKELLADGGGEDYDNSPDEDGPKGLSSPPGDNVVSPEGQRTPNDNKSTKEPSNKERSTKAKRKEEEREDKVVVVAATEEEDVTEEGEEEEEEVEYVYPGSPSFRVFFLPSLDSKDDSKNDGTNNKSQSGDSSEGSGTKIVKKGRKGRRFRRVIPKGGPVAVKNLLNVKSCYYPPCSSHDSTSLLTEKATA